MENFLGFAPSTVRAAFATHAALGCVQDAARVRDELLAPLSHRIDGSKNRGFAWPASTKKGESLRRRWFESQSCRVPRTVNGTGHTGPSEFCATSI